MFSSDSGLGRDIGIPAAFYSPTSTTRSTIDAAGFHGRVRNGNGWGTCAMTAGKLGDRSLMKGDDLKRRRVKGDDATQSTR